MYRYSVIIFHTLKKGYQVHGKLSSSMNKYIVDAETPTQAKATAHSIALLYDQDKYTDYIITTPQNLSGCSRLPPLTPYPVIMLPPEFLCVGGGGAGGTSTIGAGGGGGGGGVTCGAITLDKPVYDITVGSGGIASYQVKNDNCWYSTLGLPSKIMEGYNQIAYSYGGGHGGGAHTDYTDESNNDVNQAKASPGANGGGGSGENPVHFLFDFRGGNKAGQGYTGFRGGYGVCTCQTAAGGGGGGQNEQGESARFEGDTYTSWGNLPTYIKAGKGGEGQISSITCEEKVYGSGGGGSSDIRLSYDPLLIQCDSSGVGGTGGGKGSCIFEMYYDETRQSGLMKYNSTAGIDGTGGGGGGGSSFYWYLADSQNYFAKNGGSGIVIIRYPTKGYPKYTGGTITQRYGYTIHTFTQSGTLTRV